MEINWKLLGIVAVVLMLVIVYTIRKNQKDKKEYTDFLNNEYKKKIENETEER
ncbi:hypothetical protein FSS13T_18940 [Flavobacterium saliperosum S13]|uniref:Uncharacterized protein n=2 Tax=Flavobacterium saliperosum TaxID=329186 RepID=A0A1G4W831_9FLAO|nr:FeoB-associated Cys-rich membrane protein [Flavobacterium saliperosum]ESU24664.1 hypothetical protein FSS13T_18940 [Flavobacterium saliperosum S13]SCX18264.1 hypothetical protein SAMN02927925_02655 [Flavobacterium saliperosum]